MKNRTRFPVVRVLTNEVQRNPGGLASRLAYRLTGGDAHRPEPPAAPPGNPRVLVGPTNYAGQGHRWAHAIEDHIEGASARSLAVDVHAGFDFPVDFRVPVSVYRHSQRWQSSTFDAITGGFTHVLLESMRPVTGLRFPDFRAEAEALAQHGLSLALIAHGTDVRSPEWHAAQNPWSPFRVLPRNRDAEELAAENRRLTQELGLPTFVSTPDLLDDLPDASWCPVVVDLEHWATSDRPFMNASPPIVVHSASAPALKGTDLIEPTLLKWHAAGRIVYRPLVGASSHEVHEAVRSADVVLDQFRLGSYGVAACEALAAGRVVVGHVTPEVRHRVQARTGQELPIVEATPDTLPAALESVLADRDEAAELGRRAQVFAAAVHGGRFSADVLRSAWLSKAVPR